MKVFWSWQSDTPGKTGRHFVRKALEAAIAELRSDPDLYEPPETSRLDDIHLDHDRKDVSGSQDLARTILSKIEEAAIFVADVTPIASSNGDLQSGDKKNSSKLVMNPNVAIELGYALKAVGDSNLIMVLNNSYGDRESLPFDLRHKTGPIIYSLAKDADRKTIDQEKKKLVSNLKRELALVSTNLSSKDAEPFKAAEKSYCSATYFSKSEFLAKYDSGEQEDEVLKYKFSSETLNYLRLRPTVQIERPSNTLIMNAVSKGAIEPYYSGGGNMGYYRNEYGHINFVTRNANGLTMGGATQVFRSGEVWGCNAEYVYRSRPDSERKSFLYVDIERLTHHVARILESYLRFYSEILHIPPPYYLESGIVNIAGAKLLVNQGNDTSFVGSVYDNEVIVPKTVRTVEEGVANTYANLFAERVFDEAGEQIQNIFKKKVD